MSYEFDEDELKTAQIVEATGRSICRGERNKCPLPKGQKIPKGVKALKITAWTTQNDAHNFFCKKCAKVILNQFRICIEEFDKRI